MIQAGDKAAIYLARQLEREKKTGEWAHAYNSRVTKLYENGSMELYMPVEAGKVILLSLRLRLEILFDTKSGRFRAAGIVEERYRSENRYMLRIRLISPLYRHRMPEYCSTACAFGISYFAITPAQAREVLAGQPLTLLDAKALPEGIVRRHGTVMELSGGGICFETDAENEANSHILIQMQRSLIPAYIFSSQMLPKGSGRFVNKAGWMVRDEKALEGIIRYIFEEKRKNRTNLE